MPLPAKILIVEDDAHIRRLLHATMARAGHVAVDAADARQALALLDIEKPDVVLLDLGLPDRDGLELIQHFRKRSAATLIVVSARDESAEKVAALDLGADDYVTKPFDTEELLARIRTALRHQRHVEAGDVPDVIEAGGVRIDLDRRRVARGDADVHLTPKEYGVLAELARRPDRVLSHAHLLKAVWGNAHVERVEYLRIAVRGLRQKLEDDPSRPQLIVNELAVGYRLSLRASSERR
ncbi:MAG: response regulator transcription factor [Sphingopyxis sp.]|uniref:response regulator transcription factor n=1 Tax=Sphingopyxis sp. TaxID=1908224 RepID=UPI002AB88BC3|nr:response regulator transcription factor [Sphingopyxis sp.]MDZ3832240.1 response regulator transcription factor [Sphingopyxis sp.]